MILLGVTVLLSLTVFQQTVSESMPITSLQIPLLGKIWWVNQTKDRLQTICSRYIFNLPLTSFHGVPIFVQFCSVNIQKEMLKKFFFYFDEGEMIEFWYRSTLSNCVLTNHKLSQIYMRCCAQNYFLFSHFNFLIWLCYFLVRSPEIKYNNWMDLRLLLPLAKK